MKVSKNKNKLKIKTIHTDGTFTKTDYMLGHKSSFKLLNTRAIEIFLIK